jgi:DNA-binding transcriptional ArsR family regulator
MWELVRSLQALNDPASAALHLPWLRTLSGRLDGLDLRPAVALVPTRGFSPDFLTPAPTSPLGDIAEGLAELRATTAEQVRRDMVFFERSHGRMPIVDPWNEHPRREVTRLAGTLEAFWARAIEPSWPRIRALLDADLAHRARRLTEGGPAGLFAELHRDVGWHGDRLTVDIPFTDTVHLDGRGLLLIPSVFLWERPAAITEPPWQPTLLYPARGIATLWDAGEARTPEGLARVIGDARARLLQRLDAPRSTTELARLTGLTPGGASQHLTALRGAGLVTSRREGRLVLYVRTPLADALAGAV